MRTIYLRKEDRNVTRKILVDMAYLATHKKIRLLKYYFEDGLYFPFKNLDKNGEVDKYFLKKDKIIKEGENHFYFDFPFKAEQVEDVAV